MTPAIGLATQIKAEFMIDGDLAALWNMHTLLKKIIKAQKKDEQMFLSYHPDLNKLIWEFQLLWEATCDAQRYDNLEGTVDVVKELEAALGAVTSRQWDLLPAYRSWAKDTQKYVQKLYRTNHELFKATKAR